MLVSAGGDLGTPGIGAWLDYPLIIRVVVADPQDLCGCSCGAFGAGGSNPSEQRALKASALFAALSLSSFSTYSLFGV